MDLKENEVFFKEREKEEEEEETQTTHSFSNIVSLKHFQHFTMAVHRSHLKWSAIFRFQNR
jgi:hypothetical protein